MTKQPLSIQTLSSDAMKSSI